MTFPEVQPDVFFDSTEIPNYPRGQKACFYGDGLFRATAAEIASVQAPEFRIITVTGNGRIASIVDGRPDNALSPAQIRGFVRERRATAEDAIIYTPRAFVAEYISTLDDFGHGQLLSYERLFWWIATLDGIRRTAAELSDQLRQDYNAKVPPSRIWADQWNQIPELGPDAKADMSQLFLPWRP